MLNKSKDIRLDFFKLFHQYIKKSKSGRRLQPNGKKVSGGTICNYEFCLKTLQSFSKEKNVDLRLRRVARLNSRELVAEKKYWSKFYKEFTDYLYKDCRHFDNYVGSIIKNVRTFFGYLNRDLGLGVGEYYKQFFVRKEEIAIFPLLPEELNFLIYDASLKARLSPRMKQVKDFFVFGCTVALRFSDLVALKKSNIRIVNTEQYLVVRSIKTNSDTSIKLPAYAVEILNRYSRQKTRLLPKFNIVNLNKFIKRLLEEAGICHQIQITRSRQGIPINILPIGKKEQRFCDVASTHTMRRTAITTMLSLGLPETIVRKISGHSQGSKEFYRYVQWAQGYQDHETEKVFEMLQTKVLRAATINDSPGQSLIK